MWIRIDADMPWHDKIIGLPNDTARFAFIKSLCAAKVRERSTFSLASLREVLGSHARAIPALVAAGLLVEDGDRISIHDFDSYQRAASNAERQQRYRQRNAPVTANVTEASTAPLPTVQDSTLHTNGTPPNPPSGGTFMGYRPKPDASIASVKAQHEDTFQLCGSCGQRKGGPKHGTQRDHEFIQGGTVA